MTTLQPRGPYTPAELEQLYPSALRLQLVQVLLRHGERSPVSPRFQNAGLRPFWPYCTEARHMLNATMNANSEWTALDWRRRLETFGEDDSPVIASGPRGEVDGIWCGACDLGQLTDEGRRTTYDLGKRLRHLYVDQLGYMPKMISDADMFYLRATPIPRALESLQQCFSGFYPSETRSATFPPPTIITRAPSDETLFPNDGNCRRFAQLSRAFAQRTADRWNETTDMEYLNKLMGKWMPDHSKRVAVDSHPRLSGIMDTINSTLAHGQGTRLPKEFYDEKARAIIDKIGVEEWFSGYSESQEYRAVGIGALAGDIVSRMVGHVERNGNDGLLEVGGANGKLGEGRGGEKGAKFGLSGCHDTTLASILVSLGAFEQEPWPPYTSSIAIELFKKDTVSGVQVPAQQSVDKTGEPKRWVSRIFGTKDVVASGGASKGIARKNIEGLTESEKEKLEGHYVRIRYNDRVMKVPGCKAPGKHLEGDESFCTLAAFKEIVDKFTPESWKQACNSNLGAPAFPETIEPAGY